MTYFKIKKIKESAGTAFPQLIHSKKLYPHHNYITKACTNKGETKRYLQGTNSNQQPVMLFDNRQWKKDTHSGMSLKYKTITGVFFFFCNSQEMPGDKIIIKTLHLHLKLIREIAEQLQMPIKRESNRILSNGWKLSVRENKLQKKMCRVHTERLHQPCILLYLIPFMYQERKDSSSQTLITSLRGRPTNQLFVYIVSHDM